MPAVFSLITLISDWWFLAFVAAILAVGWLYFLDAVDRPHDRRRIACWLRQPRGRLTYSGTVTALLADVYRRLTPPVRQTPSGDPRPPLWKVFSLLDWLERAWQPQARSAADAARTGTSPWGWTLAEAVLVFSLAYPIGLMLLGWVVTGSPATIGRETILPGDASPWSRLAAGAAVAMTLSVAYRRRRLPLRRRLIGLIPVIAMLGLATAAGAGTGSERSYFAIQLAVTAIALPGRVERDGAALVTTLMGALLALYDTAALSETNLQFNLLFI